MVLLVATITKLGSHLRYADVDYFYVFVKALSLFRQFHPHSQRLVIIMISHEIHNKKYYLWFRWSYSSWFCHDMIIAVLDWTDVDGSLNFAVMIKIRE